jgi:hypothetical protein
MPLTTNFNVDPYYDDFDGQKNYYRTLFKPGQAVQSRELTQIQTNLQDQIKKFGDHIFKTGSIVTGGQITIQNCNYLNISSTFSGADISANNFNQKVIVNSANTKRAYVLRSYSSNEARGEPITFIITQSYGDPFTENETIYTANSDPTAITYYATTANVSAYGNSKAFSVASGVFYYEGFFVENQPQSIAVNKYSANGNALIGFVVSEDIVDYTEDTTLLDPAQSASNFQAPGADRYRIQLTLDNRALDSTDLTKFIELAQFSDGTPQKVIQTPIYGPIVDELARRTYDESGDYVIDNFQISLTDSTANSAFANVILGAGKAYIRGYDYKTSAPSIISIPKPREKADVINQRITSDYGYFLYANDYFGNFATNQYDNVALLSINSGQIPYSATGVVNTNILANSTIGTARIKLAKFYAASGNTQDSNNYIYKLYVTDVNTVSIGANSGYGINANTGATRSILYLPLNYSANNDAYKGMTIRMVGGTVDPSDNTPRVIIDYTVTGISYNVTVDPPFSTVPTNNWRFILDTSLESVESLARINSAFFRVASANISPMSKNQSVGASSISFNQPLFQPVSIQERRNEPLLIKIGENNVADNSVADFAYSYQKLYQGVTFTGTVSSALSYGTGESLQSASTESSRRQYYRVVVSDPGSSPYYRGQTIPSDRISVDTSARTITVSQAVTGMVVNVFATINSSNPTSKTKTFVKANTTLVDPAGGRANNIFGNSAVFVSSPDGQTIISEAFLEKRAGRQQTLFASDLHSINAILDFAGTTISTANYEAGAYINVTARYSFDTGQKDSYYDWGSITLKPGQNAPRGPLLVRYNRFLSSGSGYFNVDSYTRLGSQENGGRGLDYGAIPNFVSQDGFVYKLSDYLDFRPVRRDAGSLGQSDTYTASNFVLDADEANIGTKISEPDLDIITDYAYYLPRIDRVVLTKDRAFQVIQGVSSINPVSPIEPDDAMTLYVLRYPPYLYNTYSTQIDIYNNRRYTMRDIAKLDKRIQNLEIYTSLSIAELAALNKNDRTIRDANGLNRPKNGIFVDSFSDQTSSDITNPSFTAAIDIISRVCRGSYNIASTKLVSSGNDSDTNVEINGPVLMLASSNTTFIQQNKASKAINVNPFNVINYLGTVKLDPPSDVWKTDDRLEAQNIDLTGGNAARDAWSSIQSTTWGAWNTQWTSSLQVSASVTDVDQVQRRSRVDASGNEATGRGTRAAIVEDTTTTTTVSASLSQRLQASRTGILAQIVPQQLTRSFGDRVIDLTVVHYMRQKNILVIAEKFKPFTSLNAFFDTTKVNKYISVLNSLVFTSDTANSSTQWSDWNEKLEFDTPLSKQETVKLYAATSNTARHPSDTLIGTAGMVLTSGNRGYIVSLPTAFNSFGSWNQLLTNGIWVVGDRSGKTYRAAAWYHRVGRALGGTSVSSTVKTITLAFNAANALNVNDFVGQTLYIIRNTGAGESGTITAYEPATRIATVNGLTTTPDTTTDYSIGLLETDPFGACAGIFNCPDGVFRTGEKLFRLIDDEVGNLENSRTNGDTTFYASGIVQTKQETSITVFVPGVTRRQVTEGFVATTRASDTDTSTTTTTEFVRYIDPLAQTFLINGSQYPQGIVVDSIRVCFKTKDVTESVTCQIRPVVNGYPSATQIYPYAEKILTPDKVNISLTPNITDSTKYTEFKFDIPVLLLPGEHSFVLLSNSTGYEAFIAGINDTDLVTGARISEQPYTGSLFLSQNGSVWTADQQNDLMFAIQKRVFTGDVGYGYLEADMTEYSANVVYDVLQIMSTDVVIANTAISYEFISEKQSGGQHTLLPIVPNLDYEVDVDNNGRRILNTLTGNSTFQLRVIMSSTNRDISPMIDINRLNLLTIENKINNLPLQNTGFQVTNGGSGYTGNAKVTISTGGDGTANAYANVVSGVVDKIVLDNPGNLYITSPTITISGSGGTGATAVYNGEDKATGGNADVRYITKKVPLATGFDAGDLRVYLDLYRPPGSGILVWYKVLSESDPSRFDDNNWLLMTELSDTKNLFSANRNDYFEAVFAPGTQDSGVPANKIRYTSVSGTGPHKDFSIFQIKVVLYGSSTVAVPKFGQIRVIALPETTLVGTIIPKT